MGSGNIYNVYENEKRHIEVFTVEIRKREPEMTQGEAKIFLDHLTALYDRYCLVENRLVELGPGFFQSKPMPYDRDYHKGIFDLKMKLAGKISSPPATTKVNNTPEIAPQLKLESLIKKQEFYIEKIESFEINDDVCAAKAEVLYEHVSELYKWFISNQAEISVQVDNVALANQQTIASQIQRKFIDIQVRLKRIMKPETSDLDSLLKKSEFLIHQIKSLQPKSLVCAEEAKISYNRLASLYNSFVSNQTKIETHVNRDILEAQRKISAEIQRNVIQFQKNFMKIFEPTSAPLPPYFVQSRSTNTFSDSCSTITQDTDEELEKSRDIQNYVNMMKQNQKEIHDDLKSVVAEKGKAESLSVNFSQAAENHYFKNNAPPSRIGSSYFAHDLGDEPKISRDNQRDIQDVMSQNLDKYLEISRDIQNNVSSMKEKLEKIQDDKAEDESSSVNFFRITGNNSQSSEMGQDSDENLKIFQGIQNEVRLLKEQQNEISEDLKSILLEIRKTNLPPVDQFKISPQAVSASIESKIEERTPTNRPEFGANTSSILCEKQNLVIEEINAFNKQISDYQAGNMNEADSKTFYGRANRHLATLHYNDCEIRNHPRFDADVSPNTKTRLRESFKRSEKMIIDILRLLYNDMKE